MAGSEKPSQGSDVPGSIRGKGHQTEGTAPQKMSWRGYTGAISNVGN